MRATAVFHSRFWRALDWKNILLLAVALCIIGFDLLGRVKVRQRSLGHGAQRAKASVAPEEQVAEPPLGRLHRPEASGAWQKTRVEGSTSEDVETFTQSSPPPGYAVTRVAPKP